MHTFFSLIIQCSFSAKATNPLHRQPDSVAVSDFCTMIDKEHDGPQTALRLLAHKIQSPIEKESIMALSVHNLCIQSQRLLLVTSIICIQYIM